MASSNIGRLGAGRTTLTCISSHPRRFLGTLALETDNDLVELETPIFITSETTIAAGELADGGLAVQVTSSSIVVVAEGQQLQHIPLQQTFPARSASIVDPYIAICTQNGRLLLYELTNHPHVHLKVFYGILG
ncbi:unnamed protein product [Gongylonema pulchrum]|uniref:Nucleoporin_N domain-containing protein n=1 Tax=Gongylonema pulchrum TaxID=637853 RepID=A0A183D5W7_9BILA|nr:unnamed protein product [Gongylonema pulchrum]